MHCDIHTLHQGITASQGGQGEVQGEAGSQGEVHGEPGGQGEVQGDEGGQGEGQGGSPGEGQAEPGGQGEVHGECDTVDAELCNSVIWNDDGYDFKRVSLNLGQVQGWAVSPRIQYPSLAALDAHFRKQLRFSTDGLILHIHHPPSHFCLGAHVDDNMYWFHDGDSNSGVSTCKSAVDQEVQCILLIAFEDQLLHADWRQRLRALKIRCKWRRVGQLACREEQHAGMEQVVRSCTVDTTTVLVVLTNELLIDPVFQTLTSLLGSTARASNHLQQLTITATQLRDDLTRLVVGSLIVHKSSDDGVWRGVIDEWRHIKDGRPLYADWSVDAVLCTVGLCRSLNKVQVSECLKASFIDKHQPPVRADLADAERMLQTTEAAKQSLRGQSTRGAADTQRLTDSLERFVVNLRRGYHGYDEVTGRLRTRMKSSEVDIANRIHISWRYDVDGRLDQHRVIFLAMDPSQATLEPPLGHLPLTCDRSTTSRPLMTRVAHMYSI